MRFDLRRFWYGLHQPLLGLRTLWHTPHLRRFAVLPALVILLLAAASMIGDSIDGPSDVAWRYYVAIAGLASLPAVLFANTYARLAAAASEVLGYGPRPPLLGTLRKRISQLVRSAVLIAVAVMPLTVLLRHTPLVGDLLLVAVTGLWTLHWIVVEALDAARARDEPDAAAAPTPWFAVWTTVPALEKVPLVRRFGRLVARLARPWSEETALVARHPELALGFGLATAALLAIPIANLLLRPAIIVAAVHVRGELERDRVRAANPR